jgi:alkanesulfonate monooxygenase SsuD/methylene tetrahydromethanopterin reductase-like flavin-dependent oxidoreductase (luciferase family)
VEHEFAAFGIPRSHRRRRMETGIEYLRRAFRGEPLDDGPAGSPLPLAPLPAQGARLPIYLAGEAEPALDRAARLGDGFLAAANLSAIEETAALWTILSSRLEAYGRDPRTFPFVASAHLWVSDDPERDWQEFLAPAIAYQMAVYDRIGTDAGQPVSQPLGPEAYRREHFMVGTADEVAGQIRTLLSIAPLSELCFWYRLPGVPREAARANLRRIAQDILPLFG